jgi:hypothetical protein
LTSSGSSCSRCCISWTEPDTSPRRHGWDTFHPRAPTTPSLPR